MQEPEGMIIPGGYILLARKLLSSGIMKKPPLHFKLWIWMLQQASFKDHGNLKRGQFFASLKSMQEAMSYKVGYRVVYPTIKEIRDALDFFRHEGPHEGPMMGTTKVTHGMIVTIYNYDYYQSISNYEGHNEGYTKVHTLGTILRKKGLKKGNTPAPPSEISELRKRYPDQEIIDQCFNAISSTRKTGRMAESVSLSILRQWDRYPADQVMNGIRIYIEKEYHLDGKDEKYLAGIIRGCNGERSCCEEQAFEAEFITAEVIQRMRAE